MAANAHIGTRPERPCQVRLANAQADDGELRRGEGEQDAEGVRARQERGIAVGGDLGHDDRADREPGCDEDRLARDERPSLESGELARQRSVLGERVRQARDPGDRRGDGADQDQDTRHADGDPQCVDEQTGQVALERRGDADERSLEPLVAERGLAAAHRVGGQPDRGDEDRDDHDQPDRGEERARQRPPGLARLLGEVGHRLEAGVREHRERQREGQVTPVLLARQIEALTQNVGREQERDPEDDEQPLHDEIE